MMLSPSSLSSSRSYRSIPARQVAPQESVLKSSVPERFHLGSEAEEPPSLFIAGRQSVATLLRRLYTCQCTASGLLHHLALISYTPCLKKRLRLEAERVGLQMQRIELACGLAGIGLRREACTRLDSVLSGLEQLVHHRRQSRGCDVRITRGLIGLASLEIEIFQAVQRWATEVQYEAVSQLMQECCQEKYALIEDLVRLNAHKVEDALEAAA